MRCSNEKKDKAEVMLYHSYYSYSSYDITIICFIIVAGKYPWFVIALAAGIYILKENLSMRKTNNFREWKSDEDFRFPFSLPILNNCSETIVSKYTQVYNDMRLNAINIDKGWASSLRFGGESYEIAKWIDDNTDIVKLIPHDKNYWRYGCFTGIAVYITYSPARGLFELKSNINNTVVPNDMIHLVSGDIKLEWLTERKSQIEFIPIIEVDDFKVLTSDVETDMVLAPSDTDKPYDTQRNIIVAYPAKSIMSSNIMMAKLKPWLNMGNEIEPSECYCIIDSANMLQLYRVKVII